MTPAALERLWADLDLRLLSVFITLWRCCDPDEEELAAIIRLAYGTGYKDALTEPTRGQLLLDHGCAVPKRRR